MISRHLGALGFRLFIASMMLRDVSIDALHDGASKCVGLRRKQWMGIKAACRRK